MRNDKVLLKTIIHYCDEIEYTLKETGNDIDDFLDNKISQYACSFCIEQIGRNVKDLSKDLTNKYNEILWSDIAGMRDVIAHNYHNIILNKIWVTVTEHIPVLKEDCEKILYELERF